MLQRINIFFIASLVILLLIAISHLIFPAIEATRWANSNHNLFTDTFFSLYTIIAEWPIIMLAILIWLYKDAKTGIWAGAVFGMQAMLVSALKQSINATRPIQELGLSNLHQVKNVIIHSQWAFPSGHTASAFLGFGLLSLLTPNRYIQLACFIAALLVGYSRLYLGQHYLWDVAGGIAVAIFMLLIFIKLQPSFVSLIQKIKK